jgi:hypothetical protein
LWDDEPVHHDGSSTLPRIPVRWTSRKPSFGERLIVGLAALVVLFVGAMFVIERLR